MSITVVGPDESKPLHDRAAEKAAEQAKEEKRAAKRGSNASLHIPPNVLTTSGMKATEYVGGVGGVLGGLNHRQSTGRRLARTTPAP